MFIFVVPPLKLKFVKSVAGNLQNIVNIHINSDPNPSFLEQKSKFVPHIISVHSMDPSWNRKISLTALNLNLRMRREHGTITRSPTIIGHTLLTSPLINMTFPNSDIQIFVIPLTRVASRP